jgi:hypothetical protein
MKGIDIVKIERTRHDAVGRPGQKKKKKKKKKRELAVGVQGIKKVLT